MATSEKPKRQPARKGPRRPSPRRAIEVDHRGRASLLLSVKESLRLVQIPGAAQGRAKDGDTKASKGHAAEGKPKPRTRGSQGRIARTGGSRAHMDMDTLYVNLAVYGRVS